MNPVIKYFNGERMECLVAIASGLAFMAVAFYFFTQVKKPFYSGMAWAFLLATFQVVVCSFVYFSDAKHMVRVNQIIQTDQSKILTEELPRMEGVMRTFALSRWIETGMLLVGLILVFTMPGQLFWRGIGVGLCLVSIQLLVIDYFDERRGNVYLQYLKSIR